MSQIVGVPLSDLSRLVRQVERIGEVTVAIDRRVDDLTGTQSKLRDELRNLAQAFHEFVAHDLQAKALQLAETRIVKVRQELETKFGFYAVVRRRATGILQGIDTGVVTHEVLRHVTENTMVSAPGYWLAPALVALAAWARDDAKLAGRALDEALARDSFKTSLFFALVSRRMRREVAAAAWLEQYFRHQDPTALNREFMVLLDAIANGAFGGRARTMAADMVHEWLREMSGGASFASEQVASWRRVLGAYVRAPKQSEYVLLRRHVEEWKGMASALGSARLHGNVQAFFAAVFAGELKRNPKLEAQVDGLLDSLVTHFDAVELPLRRSELRLQLIIDHEGDEAAAERKLEAEKTLHEEQVPLTELFTHAALGGEKAHMSVATQRFAIALSRDWISQAHHLLTAEYRRTFPARFNLTIGDWTGVTLDGKNEAELNAKITRWAEASAEAEAAKVSVGPGLILTAIGAGFTALVAVSTQVWALLMLTIALGVAAFVIYGEVGKRRRAIHEEWRQRQIDTFGAARRVCAELVEYLREYRQEDQKAGGVQAVLPASVTGQQLEQVVPSGARGVIIDPAAGAKSG